METMEILSAPKSSSRSFFGPWYFACLSDIMNSADPFANGMMSGFIFANSESEPEVESAKISS